MTLHALLFATGFAALALACQGGVPDPMYADSGTTTPTPTTPPTEKTEPVDESPVDESHDDDVDDVLVQQGDSP